MSHKVIAVHVLDEEIETISEIIVDVVDAASLDGEDREMRLFKAIKDLRSVQLNLQATVANSDTIGEYIGRVGNGAAESEGSDAPEA